MRFILALVLNLTFSMVAFAEEAPKAELSGEMIDKLMKENSSTKEASTDLESKLQVVSESKAVSVASDEAQQPVFKTDTNAAATAESSRSLKSMWARMVVGLLSSLAVLGLLVFAYKKWPTLPKFKAKPRMIEVLGQHAIGPRKLLMVVRVAGESVLIGVTDQNITCLKTLSLFDEEATSKFQAVLNDQTPDVGFDVEEFSMKGLRDLRRGL